MKPRLGDDGSEGWLLLGGQGQALPTGGVAMAPLTGASRDLPVLGPASQLAQALAGAGGSGGGHAGGGGGPGSRRSLP